MCKNHNLVKFWWETCTLLCFWQPLIMEYSNLVNVIEIPTETWYLDIHFLWWKFYTPSECLQLCSADQFPIGKRLPAKHGVDQGMPTGIQYGHTKIMWLASVSNPLFSFMVCWNTLWRKRLATSVWRSVMERSAHFEDVRATLANAMQGSLPMMLVCNETSVHMHQVPPRRGLWRI